MNTQTDTLNDLIRILIEKHHGKEVLDATEDEKQEHKEAGGALFVEWAKMDEKSLWLCSAIDANPIDCTEERHDFYGLTVYTVDGEEYAVGSDSECDDAWDQSLDSYLDECIYPELNGTLANYFDNEKWKRDAKFDGRGHSLSSYNGEEIELGGDFYAYRIN